MGLFNRSKKTVVPTEAGKTVTEPMSAEHLTNVTKYADLYGIEAGKYVSMSYTGALETMLNDVYTETEKVMKQYEGWNPSMGNQEIPTETNFKSMAEALTYYTQGGKVSYAQALEMVKKNHVDLFPAPHKPGKE